MNVSIVLVASGLMGAAGIVMAAAGAHATPAVGLGNAADMLLFHAVAIFAAVSLLDHGRLWPPAAMVAVVGWIAGCLLFSGDIALRSFVGSRLFPMAAPAGGVMLIASWIAISVSAAAARK